MNRTCLQGFEEVLHQKQSSGDEVASAGFEQLFLILQNFSL